VTIAEKLQPHMAAIQAGAKNLLPAP